MAYANSIIENLEYTKEDSLTIRKSLNQLLYDEEESSRNDEVEWRLSYLKKQYESLEIQNLFRRYTQRINHGYFSLFLILQGSLGLTQFGVILYSNWVKPVAVLPDLIIYFLIAVLPIVGLIFTDSYIEKRGKDALNCMSLLSFIVLFVVNFLIPFFYFYYSDEKFRPAYTNHLIICCYVFFNIHDDLVSIVLGMFVSTFHVVTLIMVTYVDSPVKLGRILTDVIFLICMNAVGIYFRYMNDIVKRKSFLDRRGWVESNFQLKHEQQQEEQLMLSIIPQYILEKVKETYNNKNGICLVKPSRFKNFTGRHDNVSILFADIVNYTEMTTKLDITELIKTLNELFGRFDDASEELRVLRIKFLGDCYYCVAGLLCGQPPQVAENHAEACVDLGLKMISIIGDIRRRRKLNINMRIGIHSGSIISGIIGISKWQYDIWSNDVDIANKMETEGTPGKVHITKQTKEFLTKQYNIIPTDKGQTVSQFIQNGIETFLITPDQTYVSCPPPPPPPPPPPDVIPPRPPQELKNNIKEQSYDEVIYDEPYARRNTIYKKKNQGISFIEQQNTSSERIYDSVENVKTSPASSIMKGPRVSNRSQKSPVITYIEQQQHSNSSDPEYYAPSLASISEDEDGYVRHTGISRRATSTLSKAATRRSSGGMKERGDSRRTTPCEDMKRRTAFMNNNIKRYEERLREINNSMRDTIEKISLSKYQQWFKNNEINPIMIIFNNLKTEQEFIHLPDPLFKYYIIAELCVILCVFLIQNITLVSWEWTSWIFYLTLGLMIFVFIPLTWVYHLWCRHFSSYGLDAPSNPYMRFIYDASKCVTMNVYARMLIYTVICALFTTYIFMEMHECQEDYEENSHQVNKTISIRFITLLLDAGQQSKNSLQCVFPWHMTETCALAIIMSFIFLRIHLWIKFVYALTITALYSYTVWEFYSYYEDRETTNHLVYPRIAHILSVVMLTFTLQLIDRQTNYMYRLDFLWQEELESEQKEASKMRLINIKLLTNILPLHVAKLYLNVKREPDEFFHENYNDVAVMFASIINYPTISRADQKNDGDLGTDQELNILRVMNQIFVKFDELTQGNKFGRSIEKIKITKWTYMAACGLAPGLGETHYLRNEPTSHTVITLLKFATEMLKILPRFNESTGQDCRLRIGISYGKVVAGVVGSKKPLYDIWGDSVNMASRMDTTGIPNQIQVMEDTAAIIQDYGYECRYRDRIYVKGKDTLQPTYFVCLDENFDLIKRTDEL